MYIKSGTVSIVTCSVFLGSLLSTLRRRIQILLVTFNSDGAGVTATDSGVGRCPDFVLIVFTVGSFCNFTHAFSSSNRFPAHYNSLQSVFVRTVSTSFTSISKIKVVINTRSVTVIGSYWLLNKQVILNLFISLTYYTSGEIFPRGRSNCRIIVSDRRV